MSIYTEPRDSFLAQMIAKKENPEKVLDTLRDFCYLLLNETKENEYGKKASD